MIYAVHGTAENGSCVFLKSSVDGTTLTRDSESWGGRALPRGHVHGMTPIGDINSNNTVVLVLGKRVPDITLISTRNSNTTRSLDSVDGTLQKAKHVVVVTQTDDGK